MLKPHTVPEGFYNTVKNSTTLELAVLLNQMKDPVDMNFRRVIHDEIKRRATSAVPNS